MNYEEKYKEAIYFLKELRPKISDYYREKLDGLFPELAESEDERIRRRIYDYINITLDDNESVEKEKWLAWLEKQGETYTKKDVDDAWVQGVCDARRELEKQDLQNLANSAKTCKSE